MDEYPVLVKPIDYPLSIESILKCYNCGSNLFRVDKEFGILKEDKVGPGEDQNPFRVTLIDITFICAVCGRSNEGFFQVDPEDVEKGDFDSIEEAEKFLRWKEAEKQIKESEEERKESLAKKLGGTD